MSAYSSIPDGYVHSETIDLVKNKRLALGVNLGGIVIMVLLYIIMSFIIPITSLFEGSGADEIILKGCVLSGGMLLYIVLHEAVHGIAMKLFGAKKIKYGFALTYAYAGCDDFFTKGSYIVIALAPVILWGTLLTVLLCIVPIDWIWVIYFIQIINISGATGDAYVTWKFSRLTKDILVQDSGVCMKIYDRA